MADMFEAFEAQQAAKRRASLRTGVPVPVMQLHQAATKAFRTADFSGSGKLDEEEAVEGLDVVADTCGFVVPSDVRMLLSKHSRGGKLDLDSFKCFAEAAASYVPPQSGGATPSMARTAPATASQPQSPKPLDDGFDQLRVSVLEVNGLACAGKLCAKVSVTELPCRRRTRRTAANATTQDGQRVEWGDEFVFARTSANAIVVVDVWDQSASAAGELLGKGLIHVVDCRPGVPHTFWFNLLVDGNLIVRVEFGDPVDAECA